MEGSCQDIDREDREEAKEKEQLSSKSSQGVTQGESIQSGTDGWQQSEETATVGLADNELALLHEFFGSSSPSLNGHKKGSSS